MLTITDEGIEAYVRGIALGQRDDWWERELRAALYEKHGELPSAILAAIQLISVDYANGRSMLYEAIAELPTTAS